jgi:hypothetical protein
MLEEGEYNANLNSVLKCFFLMKYSRKFYQCKFAQKKKMFQLIFKNPSKSL